MAGAALPPGSCDRTPGVRARDGALAGNFGLTLTITGAKAVARSWCQIRAIKETFA